MCRVPVRHSLDASSYVGPWYWGPSRMDEATNVIERPPAVGTGQVDAAVLDRAEPSWRLSYNPSLDGIRGLAVGIVWRKGQCQSLRSETFLIR